MAENALGLDVSEDPDIIDLGWDEEEEAREEEHQRRLLAEQTAQRSAPAAGDKEQEQAPRAASAAAVAGLPETPGAAADLDDGTDDVESDFWESDDAESDDDSVEKDALDRSEVLSGDDSGEDMGGTGQSDSHAGSSTPTPTSRNAPKADREWPHRS